MNDVGVLSGRERNLVCQVEEMRLVERMEDNPDGLCRVAHHPDPCPIAVASATPAAGRREDANRCTILTPTGIEPICDLKFHVA